MRQARVKFDEDVLNGKVCCTKAYYVHVRAAAYWCGHTHTYMYMYARLLCCSRVKLHVVSGERVSQYYSVLPFSTVGPHPLPPCFHCLMWEGN